MPEIDIAGLDTLRRVTGPRARAGRLAFAVDSSYRLDIMCDIDPFFGVSAAWVIAQLDAVPRDAAEIRMRINSYGGDVFEGVAIHNAFVAHPARKVAEIIGCAASAASWVAMAADEVLIWEGAMIMIHQSWQGVSGNAGLLEDAAQVLRRIDDSMAAAYCRRTGLADGDVRAMMAAETWMSAEEAVAKGFADRVIAIGAERAFTASDQEKTSVSNAVVAAPVPAPIQENTVSPDVLAGLRGLALSMAPSGGKNA